MGRPCRGLVKSETVVTVSLGTRTYDIVIRFGLLQSIGPRLRELGARGTVGVITDRNVARQYAKGVLKSLASSGFDAVPIVLPPGESSKTLRSIERILDALARHRFERKSFLLALGGGVVGDLAGFAAAIYQRGMPFVQIPTSLVAQVDSSVGGKTGVDHPLGKNLIGAFHQPRAVWIDPGTLRTLPEREWIAGLAEVIKYGVIADENFFDFLERRMQALKQRRRNVVTAAIKRSCEIKAEVVAADERESDLRRILNYGHTFGHALEALGGYRSLVHGEAVGIGLAQEAELSYHRGMCERSVVERIRKVVRAAGLSDRMPEWPAGKMWQAMLHDKKVSGGQVMGVWPEKIGRVRIAPLEKAVFHDWYASAGRVPAESVKKTGPPIRRSKHEHSK